MLACVLLHLAPAHAAGPISLTDATAESGITFRHTDGSFGKYYIVEYVSAGLATFDYDGDGLIDIYFLNGAPLPPAKADVPPVDALYKNMGGFRFVDVTAQAGLGDTAHGLGVTAADYDNDGDQDLFLNNYGPDRLYRNNGDGTFSDVTATAGVGNEDRVGAGVCFLDGDGDGDLDLYVGNYVKFSPGMHRPVTLRGLSAYPSPRGYEPDPDTYFRNNGDGTFTDASLESGIGQHAGPAMGLVAADFDNDGDTDVFVCNDQHENFFFRNDGRGRFEEAGMFIGTAWDLAGRVRGSMGVDAADYDNDGWLDFFMTDYQTEMPALYRNSGEGYLDDMTSAAGAGAAATPPVKWGTAFVDFDNDGDRDLYIACGHLEDNIELKDDTATYATPNVLLMNTGDGRFVDVSRSSGDGVSAKVSSRGTAFDDLDNDGDVDGVVLNSRTLPTVMRNDSSKKDNHWIQLKLRGTTANRDAVGSRVTIVAGDFVLIDEVHSGRGYQSHHGTRLHFGLGTRNRIDRIEVRWLGGGIEVFASPRVDQTLTLTEGDGEQF
ncbi:MAG: VCBS repeat-containing protein [Thermoguttaceae bacterium]|nr:VCBS repeat-containing protein [Thermoguttaceae bacterium]